MTTTTKTGVSAFHQGVVYLVQPGEFVITQYPIYKIGRTANISQRKIGYKPCSKWIKSVSVNDDKLFENTLIRLFTERFEQIRELGREYFKGDPDEMVRLINALLDGSFWAGTDVSSSAELTSPDLIKKRKHDEIGNEESDTEEDDDEQEQKTIKTCQLTEQEQEWFDYLVNKSGYALWTMEERQFFEDALPPTKYVTRTHQLRDVIQQRSISFGSLSDILSPITNQPRLSNHTLVIFMQKIGIVRKKIQGAKLWFGLYKKTSSDPTFYPAKYYTKYPSLTVNTFKEQVSTNTPQTTQPTLNKSSAE